jgi:toxin ParE1/3/4
MNDRYEIEWAPVAQRDLDEIVAYIAARDSVDAAIRVCDRILLRIDALQNHPERCRIVPELDRLGVLDYRELVISPHSVFYRIRGHTVGIVGILDRRRDLAELLFRRVI